MSQFLFHFPSRCFFLAILLVSIFSFASYAYADFVIPSDWGSDSSSIGGVDDSFSDSDNLNNEENLSQGIISPDVLLHQEDFEDFLTASEFAEMFSFFDYPWTNEKFFPTKSNPQSALSDYFVTWGDVLEALRFCGQAGDNSFYAPEMQKYIIVFTETVRSGWWNKRTIYHYDWDPDQFASLVANENAELTLKSAQQYCSIRNLHFWLTERMHQYHLFYQNKGPRPDERNDFLANYFKKKGLWNLIPWFQCEQGGANFREENIRRLHQIIQDHQIVELGGKGRFSAPVATCNQLPFQLPSENILKEEQPLSIAIGSFGTPYIPSVWTVSDLGQNAAMDSDKAQETRSVRLLFDLRSAHEIDPDFDDQEDDFHHMSSTEYKYSINSAKDKLNQTINNEINQEKGSTTALVTLGCLVGFIATEVFSEGSATPALYDLIAPFFSDEAAAPKVVDYIVQKTVGADPFEETMIVDSSTVKTIEAGDPEVTDIETSENGARTTVSSRNYIEVNGKKVPVKQEKIPLPSIGKRYCTFLGKLPKTLMWLVIFAGIDGEIWGLTYGN